MRPAPGRALAALLACALILAPLAAGADLEVWTPRHRPAAELQGAAEAALGPGGVAAVDRGSGRLVLRGTQEAIAGAIALLERLDVALASWRIEARATRLDRLRAAGVEIEGWTAIGDLRVGRPGGPEGLRAVLRASASVERSGFTGTVVALDGRPAELWTGSDRLERVRVLETRPGGLVEREGAVIVPVRTGMRVTPRALPDGRVELEIAPLVEERRADGTIARAGLATRAIVRPGESVVVAAVTTGGGGTRADLGGYERSEESGELAFLVTAERIDAGASTPGASDRSP
jgi:hypothetical protein